MDASPTPSLRLSPTVELRTSLLGFLSLLPLGAEELDRRVDEAVAANPVLEREPGGFCPRCGQYAVRGRCPGCLPATLPAEARAHVDWRAQLLADARLEAPASILRAIEVLVGSLDDHGLLTADVPLSPAELQAAVTVLRRVGPPGVAADSAVDCVRVQVCAHVAAGRLPALALTVVTDHLEDVARGAFDAVAQRLGVDVQTVESLLDAVRSSTTPYVALEGDEGPAMPTDVVFRRDRTVAGRIMAEVVGAAGYGLSVARDLGDGSPEARAWLAPHLREAQRLVDALGARATMLGRVCEVLAVAQGTWIDRRQHHRPLRRADVARELGVHPSTVGRAVDGKTARLPDGSTIALADLFGAARSHRQHVAEALATHPGATDEELARALVAAGVPMARRTVAKYHAELRASGAARGATAGSVVPKPASPRD